MNDPFEALQLFDEFEPASISAAFAGAIGRGLQVDEARAAMDALRDPTQRAAAAILAPTMSDAARRTRAPATARMTPRSRSSSSSSPVSRTRSTATSQPSRSGPRAPISSTSAPHYRDISSHERTVAAATGRLMRLLADARDETREMERSHRRTTDALLREIMEVGDGIERVQRTTRRTLRPAAGSTGADP